MHNPLHMRSFALNNISDLHNDLHGFSVFIFMRNKSARCYREIFVLLKLSKRLLFSAVQSVTSFPGNQSLLKQLRQMRFSNVSVQRAGGVNSLCQAGRQGQGEVVNEIMVKSET